MQGNNRAGSNRKNKCVAPMTELYTVKEVAEMFDVSRQYINRLILEQHLKARRIGSYWAISERDIKQCEKLGT